MRVVQKQPVVATKGPQLRHACAVGSLDLTCITSGIQNAVEQLDIYCQKPNNPSAHEFRPKTKIGMISRTQIKITLGRDCNYYQCAVIILVCMVTNKYQYGKCNNEELESDCIYNDLMPQSHRILHCNRDAHPHKK